MSEIRKEITTVDPRDPKIIQNLEEAFIDPHAGNEVITEEDNQDKAIDDNVINGSTSMLLENAKEEADLILNEAREMAAHLKEQARKKGYDKGYEEGSRGSKEALEAGQRAFEVKTEALTQEYENKLREAEPEMAAIIADLVNNMVGHYAENPEVIVFLIRLSLSEINTFGSFMLKVSPEDFDYVMAHKSELTDGLSDKITVEVLRDIRLSPMDCLIETNYGNVDGSLNIRLDSLTKELKLIANSLHRNREA